MVYRNPKIIILLFFCIGIISAKAQKSVNSTGGNAVGSTGTVSYSIGQIDFTTSSNSNGSTSLGVQQPFVPTPLPVTLLSFTATKVEEKVLLKWETTTEVNSSRSVIERSKDGIVFTKINELPAAGNSSVLHQYSIEDLSPFPGSNFYRIKLVDKDGSFIYSKVAYINFNRKESIAVVYPNPAKDNITLKVFNADGRSLHYRLYHANGELVLFNKITNTETAINISHLASGNYFLKVSDNQKEIKTFQIIKSK